MTDSLLLHPGTWLMRRFRLPGKLLLLGAVVVAVFAGVASLAGFQAEPLLQWIFGGIGLAVLVYLLAALYASLSGDLAALALAMEKTAQGDLGVQVSKHPGVTSWPNWGCGWTAWCRPFPPWWPTFAAMRPWLPMQARALPWTAGPWQTVPNSRPPAWSRRQRAWSSFPPRCKAMRRPSMLRTTRPARSAVPPSRGCRP